MKQKISITIDEKKIEVIENILKEGLFRNKSHVIEYSLNKFLKEAQNVKVNGERK
jgi:Arc/MetJ-type ribon-helix-helix transcriptional regulator